MKKYLTIGVAALSLLLISACTSDERVKSDSEKAKDVASARQNYIPKNDVEGQNYNARQRIADNPTTLLWCSAFPTSPTARGFTVPIVGKLTSGNKRPFPTEQALGNADVGWFNPELPGSDGFYGSSGEYRYGFDPAGNYHDFYGLEVYCTTVPNIVQREQTTIIVKAGAVTATVDKAVEAALKACREKDPNPATACPEAARLLGAP